MKSKEQPVSGSAVKLNEGRCSCDGLGKCATCEVVGVRSYERGLGSEGSVM